MRPNITVHKITLLLFISRSKSRFILFLRTKRRADLWQLHGNKVDGFLGKSSGSQTKHSWAAVEFHAKMDAADLIFALGVVGGDVRSSYLVAIWWWGWTGISWDCDVAGDMVKQVRRCSAKVVKQALLFGLAKVELKNSYGAELEVRRMRNEGWWDQEWVRQHVLDVLEVTRERPDWDGLDTSWGGTVDVLVEAGWSWTCQARGD